MAKSKALYSPYGPRPQRSAQLVMLWMACFIFILVATWYISTRHRETAREYARDFVKPGRAGKVGAAGGPKV